MNKTTKRNFVVIGALVSIFWVYNYFVYSSVAYPKAVVLTPQAMEGQLLWQNNKCWTCHQLYGLGGYLGPDLTNVYSHPSKGPNYVKAFLNSGVKAMPKFNFSDQEKEALVSYLQFVDSTGFYPNLNQTVTSSGWVELEYKNEE